jgi:hypothetical protein
VSLQCQNCGATLDVTPELRTATCPYCASPSVVDRPPSADRPNPSFALGFVMPEAAAREAARRWVRRPLLAPQAFRQAPISDIRGVYLPAYLYSATAHTSFRASIGENYTVTESYTTTDAKGRSVTRTRTRVKTEWRSLTGRHACYVSDVVVTASRGIANAELAAVEPFDLRALRRYTPKVVSGWIAEEPSLGLGAGGELARAEVSGEIGRLLADFMPGDSHRDLAYETTLDQESLELLLLPLWVLAVRYRDDKPAVRLLVNGQSGRVYGVAPTSLVKVLVLVAVAVALLAGVAVAVWGAM